MVLSSTRFLIGHCCPISPRPARGAGGTLAPRPSPRRRGGGRGAKSKDSPLLLTEILGPVTAASRFFRADGGKQIAELVLDLLGGRHGLGDLGADQLAVAPAQAVEGH